MDYHLKKVWDPQGVMFEVNPDRGADLVLNKGWSNTPPKPAAKKRQRRKAEKTAEGAAPVTETVDDEQEVTTEAAASYEGE